MQGSLQLRALQCLVVHLCVGGGWQRFTSVSDRYSSTAFYGNHAAVIAPRPKNVIYFIFRKVVERLMLAALKFAELLELGTRGHLWTSATTAQPARAARLTTAGRKRHRQYWPFPGEPAPPGQAKGGRGRQAASPFPFSSAQIQDAWHLTAKFTARGI
jgi:hypothetical protein